MGFLFLALGWAIGLASAAISYFMLDLPAPLALLVWSSAGTGVFLLSAWCVSREPELRPVPIYA
jgi:hypothetical protein